MADLPPEYEKNLLLNVLDKDALNRLAPHFVSVSHAPRETIVQAGRRNEHVYFPVSGVYSVLLNVGDNHSAEVCTVGREGMLGLPVLLGSGESIHQFVCQIPGRSLRVPAAALRDELGENISFCGAVNRYLLHRFNQITVYAACNCLHTIEERLARWLLVTRDRAESDTFPLTQEFMAMMLGVRRQSVTVIAGVFQNAGLITYSRGTVRITDPAGLEEAACMCYRLSREDYKEYTGER